MGEMRDTRFVSLIVLIKGTLNALLGVLHIVGAFTFEATNIAGQGSTRMQRDYLIWFLATGGFILFMGLIDLLSYQGLKAKMKLAWRIAVLCAAFTCLLGCGVFVFGISPPLQLLVTGMIALGALTLSKNRFQLR